LVQEFLSLNNNETLSKIEILLKEEKKRVFEETFSTPLNPNKLKQILEASENDFKKGDFKEAENLKLLIDTWR
jgi:hypothetical protein